MSFRRFIRRLFSGPFSPLTATLALALSACISDGGRSSPGEGGVTVELQVLPAALARASAGQEVRPVDSVHVRVSGADMDTVSAGFGGSPQTISLLDLRPGAARHFEVRLFHAGRLLYAGSATADLATDRKNTVAVHCLPEFSRLSASVHVPTDFPKAIAGGRLRLWNGEVDMSADPVINGELRNFRIEEVPGDRDYAVSIALWDAAGDTIARGSKPDLHVPKGQSVALVLPLTLTFSQLALSMTVADPATTSVVLSLPGGRRVPLSFGDVVFSELYPIPSAEEGGDAAEWLELFNRAADTLDVSGCLLSRDAGTGSGMSFTLPAGTLVAPGRGLVVGRSAVAFAHVTQASSLSLTNTSARLEFSCAAGTVKVDTARYSTSASDSLAARIAAGKVASIKPSRLATRHAADAWCLAAPVFATGEFTANPGGLDGGCGE